MFNYGPICSVGRASRNAAGNTFVPCFMEAFASLSFSRRQGFALQVMDVGSRGRETPGSLAARRVGVYRACSFFTLSIVAVAKLPS